MKLTKILSQLILEGNEDTKPIAGFEYGGNQITLYTTWHQSIKREGYKSLDEIVDMYEYNSIYKPKYYDRIGVPNDLIKRIFIKNFSTIQNKMSKLSLVRPDNTMIFVKRVGESYELPEHMNYAEMVLLTEDLENYKIVTSAFSKYGDYLKKFGENKNKNSPKVYL